MREEVLKCDRFMWACGTRSRLVVHYRNRGNERSVDHPVLSLPCADPSLVRVEILAVREPAEIVA